MSDPTQPGLFPRPRLFAGGENGERHASWLELFFDLVFVVAVAELAHLLYEDRSGAGIAIFVGLFVPVWWQWIDFSYYGDQFDSGDVPSQLVTLLIMFGVIVLALTIHDVPHGGAALFAGVYAFLRSVIILLYLRAWRHVPESRELTARYILSFCIALIVWSVSFVFPGPLRFALWGLALLIEIGNGPLTYATIKNVPAQVSHMDERFGLFVILVLGEAVISVATGVSDTNWRVPALLTGFAGFLAAAGMWWIYFVRADASVINQALHGGKRDLLLSYVYGYSHFFVFAGVTAAGVGIQTAIQAAPDGALSAADRAILAGGVATFLLGATALQWAAPRSLSAPVLGARLAGVLGCVLLALAGRGLSPPVLTALVVLVLVGVITFEAMSAASRDNKAEPA